MWISDPIPVTTRIITDESGSTRSAYGICSASDEIHRKTVCWMACSGADIADSTDKTETANAPTIARHARPPEMDFGSRRPIDALMTKPINGKRGINSSMLYRAPPRSPLQRRERVRTQRLAMAEECDDQREPDRGFSGRDRHDEKRDDLPVHQILKPAGRHERDVHRVEHDFDRQQDRDHVAAQEHTGGPDGKEDPRQDQVLVERDHAIAPSADDAR